MYYDAVRTTKQTLEMMSKQIPNSSTTAAGSGSGRRRNEQSHLQKQSPINYRKPVEVENSKRVANLTTANAESKEHDNNEFSKPCLRQSAMKPTSSKSTLPIPLPIVDILSSEEDEDNQPPNKKSKESPRTPKQSLKNYCLTHGLSINRIRKANRQFAPCGKDRTNMGGRVYWDNFSPPPGYINDLDDLSMSQSQKEDCQSPAYILSNSSDRPKQPRPRRRTFDPYVNIDGLLDLPQMISNTIGNYNNQDDDENPIPTTVQNENDPFDMEDDLSESVICSLSQQLEDEYSSTQLQQRQSMSSHFTKTNREIGSDDDDDDRDGDGDTDMMGTGHNRSGFIIHTPNAPADDIKNGIANLSSTPVFSKRTAPMESGHANKHFKGPVCRKLNLPVQDSIGFDEMEDDEEMDNILSQMEMPISK